MACLSVSYRNCWNCWNCLSKRHLLEDRIQSLRTELEELMGLKNDVEQRISIEEGRGMRRLQQAQQWLTRVDSTVIEVDELIRDGPQEIQKLCFGAYCSRNSKSTNEFRKRLATSMEEVVTLKRNGRFEQLTEKALAGWADEIPVAATFGLEAMLDKVWGCLMNDQVGIVGLYGMGGIGKTTLLKMINNKFVSAENYFDVVIWVVVSKEFPLESVQTLILSRIGLEAGYDESLQERATKIFEVLHRKKFVLLLDDIWQLIDLVKLGIPLPHRENGSKIVFTTRSKMVCSQMEAQVMIEIEPLTSVEAWKLFQHTVGPETLSYHPDIPLLAQAVAEVCSGVPMAIITVARSMAFKNTPEEWKHALHVLENSPSEFPGMGDALFPILKFSYDSLTDRKTKLCFLYCALFPRDSKILKEDLIDYWICEKFWNDGIEERVAAHYIIGTLVGAGLLKDEGRYIKMNGLVRDMALSIMDHVKILVQSGGRLIEAPNIERWEELKMMSLMENSIRSLTEVPQCPDLSTLLLCQNRHLSMITDDFFQSMYSLTVLDLSNTSINEVPLGISRLPLLEYLNLSHTLIEQLPLALQMLIRLKCFKLEHNGLLRDIPRQVIFGMSSLQDLRMYGCGVSLVESEDNILSYCNEHFDELQSLRQLKMLNITITSAVALQSFFKITDLQDCTRALSLKCLWGSRSLNISPLATMKELQMLEICHINYLEELNVDFTIKGVEIQESNSLCNSAILMERSFKSLQEVMVGKCVHLQDLTWLILVPNLRILTVTACKEMKEIINIKKLSTISNVVGEDDLNPFSRLEVVVLEKLPQLKSIYWRALHFECLEKMKIIDCSMLKKLPLNSNSMVRDELVIEAKELWWNSVEWEDDATRVSLLHNFVQIP